jgi:RNA-binding protein
MALSNREKSELRGKAQALKCSVTVGKGGLTEAVREQIRRAFAGRELVKVRIQHHERDEIDRIAREIAESVPCDLVARMGFTATFFQPRA